MTISYTGNLKLALPITGTEAGTWGDVVNQQITSLLDQSVAGTVSLTSMTNADYTLTNGNGSTANEARYMALLVPATLTLTGARNIIVPTSSKAYIIRNLSTGGFAVTLKTSGGTGISVPNGKTMALYCDGTNVIDGTDYLSSLTLGTALPVLSGGTGVTTSTGTGSVVLNTSPTLVTPILGTPTSVTLTNATGLPISTGVSGLGTGVATALAVNVGTAGSPVVNGGVLGTPSSGTVTNLTGTASININGTVGATTPTTGAFTTLTTSSTTTLSGGTANGVAYLNGSKVLTTGSILTYDGSTLGLGGDIQQPNSGYLKGKIVAGVATRLFGLNGSNNLSIGSIDTAIGDMVFVNLTEQMRLTSTGLGIGTSSPVAKFQVGWGNDQFQLTNPAIGTKRLGASYTGYLSGAIYAAIDLNSSGSSGGDISFSTTLSGGSFTEKMRLDASGNLGIGTSSPSQKLEVVGNAAFGSNISTGIGVSTGDASLELGGARSGNGSAYLDFHSTASTDFEARIIRQSGVNGAFQISNGGTGDFSIVQSAVAPLIFSTNAAERMRIDSSGRLGIGVVPMATGANGSQLQIGDPAATAGAGLTIGSTSTADIQFSDATSGTGQYAGLIRYLHVNDSLSLWTASTVRATLDASGNLGLGVTPSGSYKLEISGAASIFVSTTSGNYTTNQTTAPFPAGQRVRLQNLQATDDTYAGIEFAPTNTATQNQISYIGAVSTTTGLGGALVFGRRTGGTAYTESMRLDASGNLGIGTSSPSVRLSVVESGTGSGNGGLSTGTATTGGNAGIRFATGGTDRFSISTIGSAGAESLRFRDENAGAERMRLDASGNLGIGTTSPGAKLDVNGLITTSTLRASGGIAAMSGVSSYIIGNTAAAGGFRLAAGLNVTFDGTNWRTATDGGSNGGAAILSAYGSGNLEFHTVANNGTTGQTISNASMVAKMVLDASGNLGLGVVPSAWTGGFKAIQLTGGAVASYASGTNLQTEVGNAYYQSSLGTYAYYNTGTAPTLYRQLFGDHRWFTAPSGTAGNAITFTQAMTLDASGNLLVGKTASSSTTIGFQTGSTGAAYSTMASAVAAQSSWNLYSTGAGAYRFYVGMDGTINATNTTISAISDRRFKENIQDLDVGLDKIMALQPRRFDWKEGKGKNIKNDRGFIAQEFEQVFPDLIDEWKDPAPEGEEPYKSVRQDLIPVLVKAIQEQQALITSLIARVAQLESKP